ncbi:MAG: Bifunctional phosphoglucose/phosphomannose isomerase [Methanonatronarchaeales archaeon]|nr:Bifunctional phosphoglucose/phosphomannose isomerase [Methanonatronarchaeales archaeon]
MPSKRTEELERRLARVDGESMRRHVEGFPEYLSDAARLSERVPDPSGKSGIAVAGMGGSGIGAEIMRALCSTELDLPVVPVHDCKPPRFVDGDYLFVSVSYSGDTGETISAHRRAVARGCDTLAVTSGGRLGGEEWDHLVEVPRGIPPRAALPYLLAPLLGLANRLGADLDVEDAASRLENPREPATETALGIHGSIPVIYGYGALAPAAYRWKCQLNENSGSSAFWNYFPELNHNEVEGWSDDGMSCVVLRSTDDEMERRVDAALEAVVPAEVVHEHEFGDGLPGVLSAIHLGDWVSLYLAGLKGVDPTPVNDIEKVKGLLS